MSWEGRSKDWDLPPGDGDGWEGTEDPPGAIRWVHAESGTVLVYPRGGLRRAEAALEALLRHARPGPVWRGPELSTAALVEAERLIVDGQRPTRQAIADALGYDNPESLTRALRPFRVTDIVAAARKQAETAKG